MSTQDLVWDEKGPLEKGGKNGDNKTITICGMNQLLGSN